MSIQISIGLGDDNVSAFALDQHMAALGFARSGVSVSAIAATQAPQPVAAETTAAPAEKAARARKPKDEAKPAISTNPEDRRPPEDDAATQAQDAADEAAEVEANREPEKPLTVDDVRAALGQYVTKHGMPAVQEDGPKLFVKVLGNPPAGEASWKLTLLADLSQEKLKAVIDAFETAAASDKRYGQ